MGGGPVEDVDDEVLAGVDQGASGVKTGMSATAEVVVKQEEGLNVPSSAVSRGSVTVVRAGKHVTQQVTTGLVGNSATIRVCRLPIDMLLVRT